VLCDIAAERGLMVDMHCDETDDPLSRHIETLAAETQRRGCTAASPARTSPRCTAWTTTTSRSCCR
jgi:cytosine/adenosine deaminase-related metal-dependent hydrolase